MFKIFLHKLMIIKSIYWANMCWLKGLRWGGFCNSWNCQCFLHHTIPLDKISEWFDSLARQSIWISLETASFYSKRHCLDMCGWHPHLTPHNDVQMGWPPQALIWQGIPAYERKHRWQLSEGPTGEEINSCKDRPLLCQYHRHHLIFIRTPTARLCPYRLQTLLGIRRGKEMLISKCINPTPGASNNHGIFRKEDAAHGWVLYCTQRWEHPILH